MSQVFGISLRDVAVELDGNAIVQGINLEFAPGSFTSLTGAVRLRKDAPQVLAGLQQPSTGTVYKGDENITENTPASAIAAWYSKHLPYFLT